MLDLTRGKQNRFVSFFIGLLSVIMLTLCCFTLNIGSVRAKAINYTEVDISDTLTAANWGTTMGADSYFIYVTDTNGLKFNDSSAAYWNDHSENANKNGGCDIMEYIYVNGASARALSNKNKAGETNYAATQTDVLNYGGEFAPVLVFTEYSNNPCIQIRVLSKYVTETGEPLTVTFKKGFQLLTEDNQLLTLSSDITYQDINGAWSRIKTLDTSVTAFGDPDTANRQTNHLWFTLSAHDYTTYNAAVNATQFAALNWGSKIKFTIDGEEKTLGDYTLNSALLARFARAGNPIALITSLADYTVISSITIEEGCEFPSQATAGSTNSYIWYKTTETTLFVNDGTGAFFKYVPNTYIDTSVTAFGDPDTANRQTNHLWFTLSVHDYTTYNAEVNITQVEALNWDSKIKFTIDGEEKTLGDYTLSVASLARFARAGNPIALITSLTDYTMISSVTIEAGCEFPSEATASATSGFTLYRTTEDVTFVNNGTGAFYKYVPNNYVDTAVTAFGDPGFMEGVGSESNLWFTLSTHDYTTGNNPVNAMQIAALNSHSKIKITISGVEKTLSEYTVEAIYSNKWGRAGSPLAMQLSSFDYRTIEKITIEAGCEFPSEATASATLGFTLYRTTEAVTFYNDGTGAFTTEEPSREIYTTITGVQLRADVGSNSYYLVLITSEYASVTADTAVSNPADYADLLTKIRFYMSMSDDEGVSVADICLTSGWTMNKWGSGGLMIAMNAENYEKYSGSSVYKIMVSDGAILPYTNKNDLATTTPIVFKNDSYGNDENKYGSYWWSQSTILYKTTTKITGVQLRAEVASGSYYLVLQTNEYAKLEGEVAVGYPTDYVDLLSKITLYTSEDDTVGVSAADICLTSDWTMNKWSSFGLMIMMSTDGYEMYSGSSVFKITIEAGAVMPHPECNLVVKKTVSYSNDNYGNSDVKYGSFVWSEFNYTLTLADGTTTIVNGEYASYILPELAPITTSGLTQVLVGWTTNLEELSDLYPAG